MTEETTCPRCRGVGQAVRRITFRKDGSVSTITYDPKHECTACDGTGVAEVKR
ncbi:hypothetical protein [Rhizobium mayense]|uniref:YgiT-type zinc finger protein n=1 Tax=Rhizobium mayense TaxID=1312184 RepID=A0ABT7JY38_9HYPH|nr:hypothetical protein [Rhizobium mayense]MDL2401264.1 hypothetical protein [Rhizobium mayense]